MKNSNNLQSPNELEVISEAISLPDYEDTRTNEEKINDTINHANKFLLELKKEILFPKSAPKVINSHEYILSFMDTLYELSRVFAQSEVSKERILLSENLTEARTLILQKVLKKDLDEYAEYRFIGYLSFYITNFGIGKDEAKDQVKAWYGFKNEKSIRDRRQMQFFSEENIKGHYKDQLKFLKNYKTSGFQFMPYDDQLYNFAENIEKLTFINFRTKKATEDMACHLISLKKADNELKDFWKKK